MRSVKVPCSLDGGSLLQKDAHAVNMQLLEKDFGACSPHATRNIEEKVSV